MKFIKTVLLIIGIWHSVMWVAGSIGVGNYRVYYGAHEVQCK